MIRFNVGGTPVELKLWRVAAWLVLYGFVCLWFDAFVTMSWWFDAPVELGFMAALEWVFPAFCLWPVLAGARENLRENLREIRRLRAELAALRDGAE